MNLVPTSTVMLFYILLVLVGIGFLLLYIASKKE
jgi:hypothetical protein